MGKNALKKFFLVCILSAGFFLSARFSATEGITSAQPIGQPSSASGDSATNPLPTIQKAEADGFNFELESCKLKEADIECMMNVVNNTGKDRKLSILVSDANTALYDNTGAKYVSNSATLANKENSNRGLSHLLMPQMQVPVVIRFKDVPPQTQSISALKIKLGYGLLVFRNIPITR